MKCALTVALISLFLAATTPVYAGARTLTNINSIPPAVLQRSVSPQFYKSLLISPVEGWIVVRGQLTGAHLSGTRVIHSELDGAYDSLALRIAGDTQIAGYYGIGQVAPTAPVLVHVLIYKIADGTMVLSFVNFDGAGGNQLQYYGCAKLAVLKNDGRWVDIKGPEGLEGKGWAVRKGLSNSFEAVAKLEKVYGVAGFSVK